MQLGAQAARGDGVRGDADEPARNAQEIRSEGEDAQEVIL